MSRVKAKGSRRLAARARGQSLPLIGLMIVVLVGMVGLSVDVGNTFQTERRAVAASNAAALAGMNTYLQRGSTTNQQVYQSIVNTLASNGINVPAAGAEPQPGELQMHAVYLDAQGKPIPGAPSIPSNANKVPNNVAYIQVSVSGRVDTYFARVVGRDDLPLSATAHAGICPDGEGVFPIGIDTKLLDVTKGQIKKTPDVNPIDGKPDNNWRIIAEGKFAGYTALSMDVQDSPGPGGFSWLRWGDKKGANGAGANSARELEASMTLPGNITAHFEEAAWPDADKPDDYPKEPGIINLGDWVHGSTGYVSSMDSLMNFHVNEGTRLKLPIYDKVYGNGANAIYRVSGFGIFVILDHGQQRGNKFIDLVYLGNISQETACNFEGTPSANGTYDLFGEVSIRPEYALVPRERDPVQYMVVLDVSGSMSANFDGQCDRTDQRDSFPDGQDYYQCANGPAGAPGTQRLGTGPNYWWGNVDERRVTVAKRALESLARSTNMPANAGYDNTRPADQMALVWFSDTVQRDGNITSFSGGTNFSSDVGAVPANNGSGGSGLLRAIYRAGMQGDVFRTSGGTNGAAGLYRAALAFDQAPSQITDASGKTWKYKRVVVFITDGVSNQFLNRNAGNLNGGQSGSGTYPSGHYCRTVPNVIEVATCQVTGNEQAGGGVTTGVGGVAAGMDRPITQAGVVSRTDLQAKGVLVYVVSLSNIPDTGLKDTIASFPAYYFPASKLQVVDGKTNVDTIMEKINTDVESGACSRRSDVLDGKPEWRADIPASHFQPINGLVYPTVGEVLLKNVDNDTTYTIPITAGTDGRLSYRKSDVPAGTYRLKPYVFYRHPLDPPTALPRMYGSPLEADTSGEYVIVTVGPDTATSGAFNPQVQKDLKLKLTGDVCKS